VPLQDEETPLLIHGMKHLLQVNEDPIERGLLSVGKLLSQCCLNHCGACPLPIAAAMQAVMQGNHLKPTVFHPFNELPYWLKEANAKIVPATFGDEDNDYPPKLEGYLPSSQMAWMSQAKALHQSPMPTLFGPVSESSFNFIPHSHSFRCSARMRDAPHYSHWSARPPQPVSPHW
jgi:hypothetical protein